MNNKGRIASSVSKRMNFQKFSKRLLLTLPPLGNFPKFIRIAIQQKHKEQDLPEANRGAGCWHSGLNLYTGLVHL